MTATGFDVPTGAGRAELIRILRQVRRRWRLRLALRGAAVALAAGLLALALFAYGLDQLRYAPWALTAFRISAWVVLLAIVARFLLLPQRARISDERVALYIEEHEPRLQAALLSAVQAGADGPAATVSKALLERVVEEAREGCRRLEDGRLVERPSLRRASALLAGAVALAMLSALLGPAVLRHAMPVLLFPGSARAASPYAIEVEPGDARIARGADQEVRALLRGFESERVELALQADGGWKRWPMTRDEAGAYRFLVLDVATPKSYFVEASGVRSPVFRIDVEDFPYVKRVELLYRFPSYTGLSPRKVEDGGDIAALPGTKVELKIVPTVAVSSGRVAIEGQAPLELRSQDGSLVGTIQVSRDGFYSIELPGKDGLRAASPRYAIELLADQPPAVAFLKPGRDARVTPIEEVFTELKAEDDYGIARVELVYSVNGGPEQSLPLVKGSPRKLVTAGHTFFLEELNLEPGDFVSYFARVGDNRAAGSQTAASDIYFLEARAYGREYRQADQRGAPGGGGGGEGALSQQQRQIVAATYKLVRDRERYADKEYRQDLATLALIQGRLLEQVQTLLQRMASRGVLDAEPDLQRTADSLRESVVEMGAARERLGEAKAKEALPPEQRALKHLQRAEQSFREVQVGFGEGGGGGMDLPAEDLADLFELELNKLRNQYETVQRGQRQQADERVDEAIERLRELARRQEQENERLRALQSLPGQGGAAARQRELMEQADELARRLERLARDRQMPELRDSARRLQQAVDAMRRASTEAGDGALSEGQAALDRLENARRLLEKNRAGRLEREVEEALRRAEGMRAAQERIASEASGTSRQGAPSEDRKRRLFERKDSLAGEVKDLEAQLDRMARDSVRERKQASRKLQEAADSIRGNKLADKIRYSKGLLGAGSPEHAQTLEGEIGSNLRELESKLREARGALAPGDGEQQAAGLERARDLVQRLESMRERLKERGNAQSGAAGNERGRSAPDPSRSGEQAGGSKKPRSQDAGAQEGGSQQGRSQQGSAEGSQGSATTGGDRSGAPGGFRPDEIRQWRREFRERLREAEDLRRELGRGESRGGGSLEGVIRNLGQLDNTGPYRDPLGLERLTAEALEDLKLFEYVLRRQAEGRDRDKPTLAAGEEVPPGWRSLVEEYYRSLARSRP